MHMYMYIQVLRSLRSGLSYQGRKAIAVCWDDISHLSFPLRTIREAIKTSNIGVNHVARDFVPKDSNNAVIKRGNNSYSRKCSIIWTDTLPQDLVAKAKEGCYNILTHLTSYFKFCYSNNHGKFWILRSTNRWWIRYKFAVFLLITPVLDQVQNQDSVESGV